jgi:hypothetical protein
MIEGWADDFIPPEIADNITCLTDSDHHEREGYTVSLEGGNYENDLHAAQDGVSCANVDDHDPFVTGSIYTDINGERIDANVRMIDTLLGLVSSSSSQGDKVTEAIEDTLGDQHRDKNAPRIAYAIRGHATLMSSWEDPNYFIGAFPTLFPSGLGGHLDKRLISVSLKAFTKWALNHHSRRYFLSC